MLKDHYVAMAAYSGMTKKAVTRDLNALEQQGFVEIVDKKVRAKKEEILAFRLPKFPERTGDAR